MSRDFRHGVHNAPKPPPKQKETEDTYKVKSKARREQELRHAVRHHDVEAFEDYDEWNP